MAENLGASFNIDVTNLKSGLAQANRLIRESQSEFKAAAAGMDDWRKSEEGLTARIKSLNTQNDVHKKKISALKDEYKRLEADGLDPTDKQMVELRTKINKETETLNKNEKEIKENKDALKELSNHEKNAGDEAEKSSEKMKKIGSVAGGIAKVATAAFTAITAAVGKTIKSIADATSEAAAYGDTIDKSSQKMSLSAEEYQKLSYAAELSGTNMKTMQKAQAKLLKSGSKMSITDALKKCADASDSAAAATELFGAKTAQELMPMLNSGSKGIDEMMSSAQKYGMVMSNEAVTASAKYEDSLTSLKTTSETVKNNLVSNLLPGLTQVFDGFTMLISGQEGAEKSIVKGANSMIDSIETIVPQLLNIVTTVVSSLTKVLPKILNTLISTISALLPSLINQLSVLVDVLLTAVFENGEELAKAATTLVMNLVNLVLSHLTDILQLGIQIILALTNGIVGALPELIPAMIDVVIQLCDALLDNLPTIVQAALQIVSALLQGIIKALPKLLAYMPKLISKMISAAGKSLSKFGEFGKTLLSALIKPFNGIGKTFSNIWKKITNSFKSIGTKVGNAIGGAFKNAINSVLATAEKAINFLPNTFNKLLNTINKLPGVTIGKMNTVELPRLAKGGVVSEATQAIIGEGRGSEAVLPLSDKKAMKQIVDALYNAGGGLGQGITVNQTNNFSKAHSHREMYESKRATEQIIRRELKKGFC